MQPQDKGITLGMKDLRENAYYILHFSALNKDGRLHFTACRYYVQVCGKVSQTILIANKKHSEYCQ